MSKYSDGEFNLLMKSLSEVYVYCVCSTFQIQTIMELLYDRCCKTRICKTYYCVIPYFGWARQDRKDKPRVPIGKLTAKLLETAGATSNDYGFACTKFKDFEKPVDHLSHLPYFTLCRKFRIGKLDRLSDMGGSKSLCVF
jgi:ribose-phosphate pyrophosphokinase